MSPGLFALGPGMFSHKGVIATRLTLQGGHVRITELRGTRPDSRELELGDSKSRCDNSGGAT